MFVAFAAPPRLSCRARTVARSLLVGALLAACACETSSNRPAQYPPPQGPYANQPPGSGAYAPGPYPPGAGPQPGAPPGAPPPGGQPQGAPPGAPPPAASGPPPASLPPVGFDPINAVDIQFLRGRSQLVIRELLGALQGAQRQRVDGVPLVIDDEVGEVNAYAACTREGKALMAISDGLLDIEAHLAMAKATDEIFGTRKVDEYVRFVAQHQRPKQPIVRPAAGFFNPAQHSDPRKVQRQHQLLDEQIAFVLGHELAHHYLGHLPCTAGGSVSAADVARVLSSAVPVFNQPNELAADIAGTNNLLNAGKNRQGYRYNEGGALLTMQFFAGLDQLTPTDIIFGFERTHPAPQIRTPVIQQAAASWRSTGGWPFPLSF